MASHAGELPSDLRFAAAALAASAAGVVIHAADTSILYANAAAKRIIGLSDLEGRVAFDEAWIFADESGRPLELSAYPVNRVLASGAPVTRQVIQLLSGDGARRIVVANANPVRDDAGDLLGVVVVFEDVTAAMTDRSALANTLRALEMAAEASPRPILITTASRRIRQVNQEAARVLGWPANDLVGQQLDQFIPPTDLRQFIDHHTDLIDSGVTRGETMSLVRADGTAQAFRATHIRVDAGAEGPLRLTILGRITPVVPDVSAARSSATAEQQAMRDPVTGVLRREVGLAALADVFADSQRTGQPCGVVCARIGDLQLLNVRLGISTVDRLLRDMADTVTLLRTSDEVIARVGASTFLAVLPRADRHRLEDAATALASALEQRRVAVNWGKVGCEVSWASSEDADTSEQLLMMALVQLHHPGTPEQSG